VTRHTEIDDHLSAAAANWRLPRMPAVDRNVLRIGVLELLDASDALPPAVVINEAIELARRYGSADSPAFVNGVLDQCRSRLADGSPPMSDTEKLNDDSLPLPAHSEPESH
jgi:N utilization substance protein B